MPLFHGHSDVVFAIAGNVILAILTFVGFARQRDAGWLFLCLWAILELAVSVIEALISFDYIALRDASRWIEFRSWPWFLAKVCLVVGLCIFAVRRRPLRPGI
jgi:cell division protein FtsW (lipid II flippase)